MDKVDSKQRNEKAREREIEAGRTRILERWIPRASDAEPKEKPSTAFADPANLL